jgi:hypothetical protein
MEISDKAANPMLGESIALIESKNGKNKIVYLKEGNSTKSFECEGDEKCLLIPNVAKERQVIYCSGMSGSGKSYYIMQYSKQYQKMYPKNDVILFSGLDSDEGSLDKIKNLKRFNISADDFLEEDFQSENFKDCLVIFDDLESINNKFIFNKVMKIQETLLTTGRHSRTSVAVSNHSVANGRVTKLILNESNVIVIFKSGLGNRILKYILDQYLGLDKDQIIKIKRLRGSRSITIIKSSYPMVLLYDRGGYVLAAEDDD